MPLRIVIACWGSFGDIFPYVGLAKALLARGHRPLVAAPEYYRPAFEREAIAFAPVGPDVDPAARDIIARVMHPTKGTEAVVRDLIVPAVRRTYAELLAAADGADVLVGHPLLYPVPWVAHRLGVPWISTLLAPLGFFSLTDLPAMPPAPRLVHLRRLGPWFPRLMVGLARRATRAWMAPVEAVARELGVDSTGHPLFEGQFSPTMTLAMFSTVMAQPQPDWPPNVRVTGFVFYNGPDVSLEPQLDTFLDAGPPPVVFTLGSSAVGAAGGFYHESVDAVHRLGMRAVLLVGPYEENRPARLPPDVLVVDRAPHQLLFPRASAIVHQGGAGTTGQALRSGHPMLVVPHGHDQPDNAFRVTNLGVARTLFPQHYRAARVARHLQALLEGGHYRERAAAVATTVRQEGGASAAADAIESVAGVRG